eukprot:TRINITY_DN1550_c0_g1_i1.p1 TRINITY_DN1550_c0_g1~~TRINITY_DN1550_c0_g1_i1.p1  ORF type:complete len:1188 (-),score=522.49 TRINITY_DN1550_c0_g1_i1:58-3585(-)
MEQPAEVKQEESSTKTEDQKPDETSKEATKTETEAKTEAEAESSKQETSAKKDKKAKKAKREKKKKDQAESASQPVAEKTTEDKGTSEEKPKSEESKESTQTDDQKSAETKKEEGTEGKAEEGKAEEGKAEQTKTEPTSPSQRPKGKKTSSRTDTLRRFFFREKSPDVKEENATPDSPTQEKGPTPISPVTSEEGQSPKANEYEAAIKLLQNEEAAKKVLELFCDDEMPIKTILIEALSLIKEHQTNANIVVGCLQGVRLNTDKDAIKHLFRENSGMPVLLELMKSENDAIRKTSVRFLGDLVTKSRMADNVSNAAAWNDVEGIAQIVKMLNDKPDIQIMAAGVIRVLASFEERSAQSFQEAIRLADGLKPFVSLVGSDNTDMIKQAANAIRYLTNGNGEHRKIFVDAGVVPVIIKQLETRTEESVQLSLLGALSAVSQTTDIAAQQLVAEGHLKFLLNLLKTASPDVKVAILSIFNNISTGPNEKSQTAIRQIGVLDELFTTLSTENPALLRSACITLAASLQGNAENVKAAADQDVLNKLLKMTEAEQPDNVLGAILDAIRSIISTNPETQSTLLDKALIQKIVSTYLKSANLEVRESSIEILRQCRANEKIKPEILAALPRIVESMASTSYSIQESAIFCLESLTADEAGRTAVVKQKNAIDNIIKVFDCPKEVVVMRACVVMDKLIQGNLKVQEMFSKAGVSVKLVGLLSHPAQRVKQHAAYGIWALSNMNEQGQKAMNKAKAIPALVALIGKDETSNILKEYVAGAICALTQDDAGNKKALVAANGYEALVPLLSSDADAVLAASAKAIWASAENNVANQTAGNQCIPALAKMLKSKTILVQASSASALWSLCHNNVTNQNAILEVGAIPDLVDIVDQHYKDYVASPKENIEKGQALLACIGTIHALALKNPACKEACVENRAIPAIEALAGVTDRHLQKEVAGALSTLGKQTPRKSRSGSLFASVSSFFSKDEKEENKDTKENKEKEGETKVEKKEDTASPKKSKKKKDKKEETKEGEKDDSKEEAKPETKEETKPESKDDTAKTEEKPKDEAPKPTEGETKEESSPKVKKEKKPKKAKEAKESKEEVKPAEAQKDEPKVEAKESTEPKTEESAPKERKEKREKKERREKKEKKKRSEKSESSPKEDKTEETSKSDAPKAEPETATTEK